MTKCFCCVKFAQQHGYVQCFDLIKLEKTACRPWTYASIIKSNLFAQHLHTSQFTEHCKNIGPLLFGTNSDTSRKKLIHTLDWQKLLSKKHFITNKKPSVERTHVTAAVPDIFLNCNSWPPSSAWQAVHSDCTKDRKIKSSYLLFSIRFPDLFQNTCAKLIS